VFYMARNLLPRSHAAYRTRPERDYLLCC
jgi:hypothetical protein